MAKIISLMSRLSGEIRKNGITNTYYKVKEKARDTVFKSEDFDYLMKILIEKYSSKPRKWSMRITSNNLRAPSTRRIHQPKPSSG